MNINKDSNEYINIDNNLLINSLCNNQIFISNEWTR